MLTDHPSLLGKFAHTHREARTMRATSVHAKVITAYHGSGCAIEQFDYTFTGQGNDQNGSGFYFTTDLTEAIGYCTAEIEGKAKLGGLNSPTVHVSQLTFKGLINNTENVVITKIQAQRILMHSPILDNVLENWDASNIGQQAALEEAAVNYTHDKNQGPVIHTLFALSNDFFPNHIKQFNTAVYEVLGIDGVEQDNGESIHYLAFFPEQIKVMERMTLDAALERVDSSKGQPIFRPKG